MILVTGGFGLIGSNIARKLLHEGYEVIIIDEKINTENDFFQSSDRLHFEKGSILDQFFLTTIFKKYDIQMVIHAAATTDGEYCKEHPVGAVEINTLGTLYLLEFCRIYSITRFIYISSGSIFGQQTTLDPIDESISPVPMNPYATTKMLSEELVRCYQVNFGLSTTNVRISHVFGSTPQFRKPRWNQGPIGYYFWKVLTENKLNEEAGLDFQANFTYVDDVAEGIHRLIEATETPLSINLGSEKMYSNREILEFIQEKLPGREIRIGSGVGPFIKQAPLRGPLVTQYKKEIGYQPKVVLKDALNKHYLWMKAELDKRGELHEAIDK